MVVKTIFMLSLYFIPYSISISGLVTSYPIYLLLCLIMGTGVAGIGLSILLPKIFQKIFVFPNGCLSAGVYTYESAQQTNRELAEKP